MMNTKVPFIPKPHIEHATIELLRKYSAWKGETARPPIDVDEIVEGHLELEFEIDDLQAHLGFEDVLGSSWFDKDLACIDSSLEGNGGRIAFTAAHEIGHWQLHRPHYEMDKVTLPYLPTNPVMNIYTT